MLLGKKSQDGIDLREETGEVAEALLANGYLPVETVGELPSANYYETLYEVSEDGTKLLQSFYVPPQAPRTFSKMKVVMALMKRNLWIQVKTFIEQAGLYDLYLAAQTFSEDNEYFSQALSTLKATLGVTEETVEEILGEATV